MANPFLVSVPGQNLPRAVKDKFYKLVKDGVCYTKKELCDRCGVSYSFVRDQFKKYPELQQLWDEGRMKMADEIETCGVEMCRDEGCHPIARQKMIEFMLPKLKPEIYGESAEILSAAKSVGKRIIVAPVLQTVKVDANGIPIGSEEAIDIPSAKSESPL